MRHRYAESCLADSSAMWEEPAEMAAEMAI